MTRFSRSAALVVALLPLRAAAQPSESDKSLAQSLFEQGKSLMDAGGYEQACPKLEESQRLDPGGGTLLNLALCHEKQGRIATAWSEFKEALSAAKHDARQDRIDASTEHIAAIEPKLPSLTLTVPNPSEEQVLKLDGNLIGRAAWGTPVAIDPGGHEFSSTAPGKKPWVSNVTIAVSERKSVEVPPLEVDPNAVAPSAPAAAPPGPAPSPSPAAPPSEAHRGSPTLGWVLGGAGVAAIGVGSYFGVRTLSKKSDSDKECPTDTTCSDRGVTLNDEAKTSAWISNIGIGLGLVGVGIGTYIIVSSSGSSEASGTAPSRDRRVALRAGAVPGGGALSVSGSW